MTHKKNTIYSERMILVGILILGGIVYALSAGNLFARYKNNTKTANTSNYSCPMMRNRTTSQQGGGCGGSRNTATVTPTTTNTVNTTNTYETINAGHNEYSLIPETIQLTAGKNYKLVITPSADGGGCMNNMTLPGIDNKVYPVKKGVPVTIVINNAKAGTYELVCGNMGMHQGTIIIQ